MTKSEVGGAFSLRGILRMCLLRAIALNMQLSGGGLLSVLKEF